MSLFNKSSMAALGLVLAVAATPGTAQAGGRVHIEAPIISVGFHDRHDRKHRRAKRHHRSHQNYYGDYRPRDYRYRSDRRYKKRYNRDRYHNNYYYGGERRHYNRDRYYRDRYNDRRRPIEICPIIGFSLYIDRNRDCYGHKDHYHCS